MIFPPSKVPSLRRSIIFRYSRLAIVFLALFPAGCGFLSPAPSEIVVGYLAKKRTEAVTAGDAKRADVIDDIIVDAATDESLRAPTIPAGVSSMVGGIADWILPLAAGFLGVGGLAGGVAGVRRLARRKLSLSAVDSPIEGKDDAGGAVPVRETQR